MDGGAGGEGGFGQVKPGVHLSGQGTINACWETGNLEQWRKGKRA